MIARYPALSSLLFAAAMLLGGCATPNNYPSLAPRPVEGVSLAEPAPRPGPPSLTPAAAAARYRPLLDRVRAADGVFARALAADRKTLAAGHDATVGSDAWGAAQEAYSRVAAKRGDVAQAIAALQSATEAPEAQTDPVLATAGARALDQARAIDDREATTLRAMAPRPA